MTAMQELIEWIELGEGGWSSNDIIQKTIELLEKEKQQIIDAHTHNRLIKPTYETFLIILEEAEDYYNQTTLN